MSHIFPVTGVLVYGSINSPAGTVVIVAVTVVIVAVIVALVVGVGTGLIVSVCPSVVTVRSPDIVKPGGSVRTTEDLSGWMNVSTFEVDADDIENTLDVIDIGCTVNVEPDIVRVSSPVTEALAGTVRVTTGPLGSVSVSTTKDADA